MLSRLFHRLRSERHGPRVGVHGRMVKSRDEEERTRGHGNWACWESCGVSALEAAAASWAAQLPPGDRYWLCWNVQDDWCRLQQRLVLAVGWTPVVGFDPAQVADPTVLPGAMRVDFQAGLSVPNMWMHFPLEFAFEWTERLAFWHSDVLLPLPAMRDAARRFARLTGPVTAAVFSRRSRLRPRGWNNADRWFELLGCTTRAASRSQFHCGAGWWRHFQNHPNCDPVPDLVNYHWDHGGGIRYWQRAHGGVVERVRFDDRHHFSAYHRPDVRPKGAPLGAVDLPGVAAELGIERLLDA